MHPLKTYAYLALGFVTIIGCSKKLAPPVGEDPDGIVFGGAAPKAEAILSAADKTASNLENGRAAFWIARFVSESGAPGIDVDVVRSGENSAWVFRIGSDRKGGVYLRVVKTNGLWIVAQQSGVSRWKPFEAPLEFSTATALLAASNLKFVTAPFFENTRYYARRDALVEYKIIPPPREKEAAEAMLRQLREVLPRLNQKQRASTESNVRKIEAAKEGGRMVVDEELGFFRNIPFFTGRIQIQNFKWLEPNAPQLKALTITNSEATIADHTAPVTDWDLNQCALVMYDPVKVTNPETPPNPDVCILNLANGDLRRVPFRGAVASSACFLEDRREVIVSSFDPREPDLVKVNLQNGENSIVGRGQIERGRFVSCVELSPDGKQLAFAETAWDRAMLAMQIRVMDIQSEVAAPIGSPFEMLGNLSWRPDGKGFVFTRALSVKDMDAVPPRMITLMRLDGTIQDLGPGELPVVLRKSNRILFRSESSPYHWMTMDFTGGDKKVFGNGFENYVFPGVSADEANILFQKRAGPQPRDLDPYLFDVGGGDGRRVTAIKGYFGEAWWR
jgi:hypothetical protein